MASIVLFDSDGRFDCFKCTSDKNLKAQGRDEKFIRRRIAQKMKNKGCINDTKQPVFRLRDGGKVFRCPKAISDDYDSISHFNDFAAIRDNLYSIKKEERPIKWHQIMRIVRGEIAVHNNEAAKRINNNYKSSPRKRKR